MIYLLGDVHGRFGHILTALQSQDAASKTVIFLGDIEAQRPFEDEIRPLLDAGIGVWFIHGNHDSDSHAAWHRLEGSAARNLHGRVVEIEGVRVAGLGGIFRGEVWYPDHPALISPVPQYRNYADYERSLYARLAASLGGAGELPTAGRRARLDRAQQSKLLKHRTTIFPEVHDRLALQQADVLVTHEAPSCHPYGFALIDRLARSMRVSALFHGHQHDCRNYRNWDRAFGFCAYGVGLRGITDLVGQKVLAGEEDGHPLAERGY